MTLSLSLAACSGALIDLSPPYEPGQFVVPDDWRGIAPFAPAQPTDPDVNEHWWQIYNDAIINEYEEQIALENPSLHAAAERFVQARYEMMKVRAGFLPRVAARAEGSVNKRSQDALFLGDDDPLRGDSVAVGAGASWEPDLFSAIRNSTTSQIYRAQEQAARYAAIKLMLHAELASHYFILRGLDQRNAIYRQSIDYYNKTLGIVGTQYRGKIGSLLDVSRARYLLASTQAKQLAIEAKRQIVEHAIAILLNRSPTTFRVAPVERFTWVRIRVPKMIPSTLLERRPDIAGLERRMAQANKMIGVAKAAFYPSIGLGARAGYESGSFNLFHLLDSLWSYGAFIKVPLFEAGYRRAQLQQSWSIYREVLSHYRAGVLNAFREVEDSLTEIELYETQLEKQLDAVNAADQTQNLSLDLYKGGLASSLDLIYAQVNTLEARIREAEIQADLFVASVSLVRALGGGWSRSQLPTDESIQPFGTLQYTHTDQLPPAGGIEPTDPARHLDLTESSSGTKPGAPAPSPTGSENEAEIGSSRSWNAQEASVATRRFKP